MKTGSIELGLMEVTGMTHHFVAIFVTPAVVVGVAVATLLITTILAVTIF